jgi:hypothetical protein
VLKKLIAAVAALVVGYCMWRGPEEAPRAVAQAATSTTSTAPSAPSLERAIAAHARGAHVEGRARVTKLLPDDTRGVRHQRFLLRTDAGSSVLVAHNLGIAPRINGLKAGTQVGFSGEYVWDERGGVIHWTHHDPAHRHAEGYIRYDGRVYR